MSKRGVVAPVIGNHTSDGGRTRRAFVYKKRRTYKHKSGRTRRVHKKHRSRKR